MEAAKKTRTATKARLTIAANRFQHITLDSSEQQITQCIESIEEKLLAYDETQSEFEKLLDTSDLEEEIGQSEIFREEKVGVLVKAKELLATKNIRIKYSNEEQFIPSQSVLPQVRLPQLELPKFGGDHTQWQSYWDKFSAIVHNTNLPIVSKFTYLQATLKGEALASVQGLALTEANYEAARDILEKCFGRKERIVFSHIQKLLNLSITGKNTNDLWNLYDELQTNIRSLEAFDITGDTYSVILTPLVLYKLPENIRLEWARQGNKGDNN